MIDFYFSYRSPYSYLILPRMLKLKNEYNLDINFKIVYPIAIRFPEFFERRNILYFLSVMFDIKRKAKKLNMPLTLPLKPDPIRQNTFTGTDKHTYIHAFVDTFRRNGVSVKMAPRKDVSVRRHYLKMPN